MNAASGEETFATARAHAAALDAADPLANFRDRFLWPRDARGETVVYLSGHSLGLQPRGAAQLVAEELEDWSRLGVAGHEHARRPWIRYHEPLCGGLAALVGAREQDVIAMNTLTVNLHLMLASFYRPSGERRRILVEAGAFSSDRHAVVSQLEWHGLDANECLIEVTPRAGEDLVRAEDLDAAIAREGARLALVLWPGVQYRTGQSFDLARITRAAHATGALAGFDLAHAIGNVPLALDAAQADFAVWCNYKYLNAGPGAVGGAFVHARHSATQAPRLAGWWGHELASRFAMRPGFRPAAGAAGWAVSNPPVLAAAPLIASLALFEEARMERLREKSVALTGFLEELLDRHFAGAVRIVTPRAREERGAQLSLRLPGEPTRGKAVFDALIASDVSCDWREPDIIRVAPAPLYNSFGDVVRFAERLAPALRSAGFAA
jgi:kynureninase